MYIVCNVFECLSVCEFEVNFFVLYQKLFHETGLEKIKMALCRNTKQVSLEERKNSGFSAIEWGKKKVIII